uniref:G-patch domain-containing protein n=1 Tax=Tetradesmus obliquus TaxID=3088 RepID=A0A383WIT6_TETOB|eukprot:jgi/Sobl393_1/9877/SZX77163.1
MSSKPKPAVNDLFGDDSDDELPRQQHGKRPRSQEPAPALPASSIDPQVREVADKLADFVAKNGRHYEDMTRDRNPGNTPFKFLWDKSSKEYRYYQDRLNSLLPAAGSAAAAAGAHHASSSGSRHREQQQDAHRHAGSHTNSSSGRYPGPPAANHPPHLHQQQQQQQQQQPYASSSNPSAGSKRSRWETGPPPAAAAPPAAAGPPAAAAAAAAGPGASRPAGTLSAMEEYMKRLDAAARQKQRDDEAAEEEEERRRRAAAPLLKETAFDRRKVVAVYKDDGARGHHMDDFIPKEELAKFMAKCGDDKLAQQVEAQSAIGADNIGHKLLQKMGWKQGKGIGAKEDGRTAPVAAAGAGAAAAAAAGGSRQDTLGLGAAAHGAVEEGDDPFEQYRKRMMLGYKYRPNPLGNPRKPYY